MALNEQQRKSNLRLGLFLATLAAVVLIVFVAKIIYAGS